MFMLVRPERGARRDGREDELFAAAVGEVWWWWWWWEEEERTVMWMWASLGLRLFGRRRRGQLCFELGRVKTSTCSIVLIDTDVEKDTKDK